MADSIFKVHPITCHEHAEGEQRYTFTLSLTSPLDWVGGKCHALAALPPVITWYPVYSRLACQMNEYKYGT
jgi:hypothetical protein